MTGGKESTASGALKAMDVITAKFNPYASQSFAPAPLLACPWCDSEKVMAEGTDKRMAMVCQKCLARGPEVNVTEGRDVAIREWNKAMRQPHQKTRYECERCGMTVALVYYGWLDVRKWKHVGGKSRPKRQCCGLPPKVRVRQANSELRRANP